MNLLRRSPPGLDLRGQTEVVVTMLSFNQFPHFSNSLDDSISYDPGDPARCSDGWNKNATTDTANFENVLLSLRGASLVTRSFWEPAQAPPEARPRLFGNNAEWLANSVTPFYDQPCVRDDIWNPGWGWDAGVPDYKGRFEKSTLGYATCLTDRTNDANKIPETIMDHSSVAGDVKDGGYARSNGVLDSGNPTDFNSSKSATSQNRALAVFHLLRRLRDCHANSVGSCQFSQAEIDDLIDIVLQREQETFDANARDRSAAYPAWGWEQDTDGGPTDPTVIFFGYDLFTAAYNDVDITSGSVSPPLASAKRRRAKPCDLDCVALTSCAALRGIAC